MVAQVSKKQTEIKSAVVFRCTCKTSGEIFYAVPSDSTDETYKVTYNAQAHRYECSCPATCECKHLRAVRSVVLAKAEIAKQGNTSPAPMPYTDGLKTSFATVAEEYEYRLHTYGKKSAVHWAYEQKQHTAVEVVPAGQAEQIAAQAEVQAERKMDTFKQAMEVEETRASYMRHFYDEY